MSGVRQERGHLFLMLGPKSNNLIISLFSDLLAKNILMILFLSFFLELSNILSKALDLIIGRGLLLTKKIDLTPKLLVLDFGLVKLNPLGVNIFRCGVELDVVIVLHELSRIELFN